MFLDPNPICLLRNLSIIIINDSVPFFFFFLNTIRGRLRLIALTASVLHPSLHSLFALVYNALSFCLIYVIRSG